MIKHTFVPKSVKAIAILFLAISKLGDIAKHLKIEKKIYIKCEMKISYVSFTIHMLNN